LLVLSQIIWPITVGCNIGCKYCVLKTTFGNDTKPRTYTDPEFVGDSLRKSRFFYDEAVLCLFNYTDALLRENQEHLIRSLKNLKERNFRNLICIPTKVPFDRGFAETVAKSYHEGKIIFLLSLSGLPADYEPRAKPNELINTMRMLKDIDIPVIHYWRPITSLNCDPDHINTMLDQVSEYAKCSIVVGLKASKALNEHYLQEGLISRDQPKNRGDYLPDSFMSNVSVALKNKNKYYSVYLHASCAISKITGYPDYNGTMFSENICSLYDNGASICNNKQKKICKQFKQNVEQNFDEQTCYDKVKQFLPDADVRVDGHEIEILSPIRQEDLIWLIHRIKHPVRAKNTIYTNQYVGSILSNCPETTCGF
jgi:DNA repair photolyase